MDYTNCTLCPRMCGANRTAGETGFCGCPDIARVAKTMLHKWEEPALAGSGGSGAIFFGGCTLGCTYCQNRAISGGPVGRPVDSRELRQIMEGGEYDPGFSAENAYMVFDGEQEAVVLARFYVPWQ